MKILNKKLFIKAIVYRVLAFIFIFLLCLILTKKIHISIIAGVVEFIFKILLYYVYEIFWKTFTIKKGVK